ncbi:MAG: HEAT repeat domain-containing protein [Candidatus Latescibacterota bacterium]|nr:MAG: HEAT repeat domain-containing protein [Candidatus Latescibacterota bacterium]
MNLVKKFQAGRFVAKLKSARGLTPEQQAELKRQIVSSGASALDAVMSCLSHGDARNLAMEVLDELLTDDTLGLYIQALSSTNPAIVSGVTKVLSRSTRYTQSTLLPYLAEGGVPKSALATILLEQAEAIAPQQILAAFHSFGKKDVRVVLMKLLDKRLDAKTGGELLPLLQDEDWWLRVQVIKLLARFEGPTLVQALVERLADANRSVRLEAVKGLHRMRDPSSVPGLVEAIRDPDLKVQTAAIDALADFADVSAVPHLLRVLTDESEQARRGAVEVLNEVATTDAIQDLVRALHDEDWWVRVRAADALGSLGGDRVVEAVIGLMDESEEFIRRYAVEILNTIPDARAVPHLIRGLQDEDWWVRERSIDALGNNGDARAVEPLLDLMETDHNSLALCVRALGEIGDARALPSLCRLVRSEREDVRREATQALMAFSRGELSADERSLLHEALRTHSVGDHDASMAPFKLGGGIQDPATRQVAPPRPLSPPPAAGAASPVPTGPDSAQPPSAAPAVTALNYNTLAKDTMLLDRYRIVRKIGVGGFGAVYLVEDAAIQEEIILKILNPQLSADESGIRRFTQELKLTRKITDRNVIRIFDILDLGVTHAVSMEYFPGQDLGRLLASEGTLPTTRTLRIVQQVCRGLSAAHDAGVMHRDIKPANILVGAQDSIKLVDFGLASMQQTAGSRLTKSGLLIGTPEYMAPELIRGDEADIDQRVDIYSLGVVMYEMLSGKKPYVAGTPVKILFQHLEGEAEPLQELVPGIPPQVVDLVQRTMARSPAVRPQSARDLRRLIEREFAAHTTPRSGHDG